MVIAMRAAHFVSWGPLSAQDMGLVWLRHCMCSQKKEITHLFRKSLCIRMRISSLTSKLDSKRNWCEGSTLLFIEFDNCSVSSYMYAPSKITTLIVERIQAM